MQPVECILNNTKWFGVRLDCNHSASHWKVVFPSVLVKGVFSESCGNFKGTKSYPDESPKLKYLQVSFHTRR